MKIRLFFLVSTFVFTYSDTVFASISVCDSGCDQTTISAALAAVPNNTQEIILVKSPYTSNERVPVTKSGAGVGQELKFQANVGDTITMQGFYINGADHLIIDGFDMTGYTTQYYGIIELSDDSDYVHIINNTIRDGAVNVYGVNVRASNVPGYYPDHLVFENNHIFNILYQMVSLNATNAEIKNNTFGPNPGGADALRTFGSDILISQNEFIDIENLVSNPNHTDIFQTFGDNGEYAHDILFEKNHIHCSDGYCESVQLCNLETAGSADIHDLIFRNNIWDGVSQSCASSVPNTFWYNNIFINSGRNTFGPLGYRNFGVNQVGTGEVKNNIFIGCGSGSTGINDGDRDNNGWWYEDSGTTVIASNNYVSKTAEASYAPKTGWNTSNGNINGGDPFFQTLGSDYHIQSSSMLRDVGSTIASFADDYDSIVRPEGVGWDIGPYEYVSPANMVSSVTQYGITWTFDHEYACGQYVNGDYWVVGPVTITSITPDATLSPGRNGWEINPNNKFSQPYDDRAYYYSTSTLPSLPSTVAVNSSVVKSISNLSSATSGLKTYIQTAAVITVVPSIPPNGGINLFRPPYFGISKPSYTLDNINLDLLATLGTVSGAPTLDTVYDNFKRVQLDHIENWPGDQIHPIDNMPDYGSEISNRISEGILRLSLNDSTTTKRQAAIAMVQMGIDFYQMRLLGHFWFTNGGEELGRKQAILFAGIMLNDQTIKDAVSFVSEGVYQENENTFNSTSSNMGNRLPVWGQYYLYGSEELHYWTEVANPDSGQKTIRDPYGYIDGGDIPGSGYQGCCTTMSYKYQSLAIKLLPDGVTIWNDNKFFDYVDRWVTVGVWTLPDPCAPYDGVWGNYGITFGPNGAGGCILDTNPADGIGRFPLLHGTFPDGAGYNGLHQSTFGNNMYSTYNSSYDISKPIIMNVTSSASSTQSIINWTTNELSNSQVEYGTTTGYGASSTLDTGYGTNHTVTLTGLAASTPYHYRIHTTDPASNLATSIDYTFTTSVDTTPPTITSTSSSSPSNKKKSKKKKKISSKITYKQGERVSPYITLLTPKKGSLTNKSFAVKASASDKSGIQAMFVSINGTKKKRVNNIGSILYTAKKLKNATVSVTAYDKLGNVKSASITITNGKVSGVRYY